MHALLSSLAAMSSALWTTAHAQEIQDAIDAVSGQLLGVTSATGEFGDIAAEVALAFMPILNGVAIMTIVIAGLLSVIAQDENRINSARFTVVSAIIALVLINASGAIADAYLTAFDFDGSPDPAAGAEIIHNEILGFVGFVEVPLAIIAVLVIIISGIKAVIDYSGDKGLQQFRGTFFSIVFGVIIILIKELLADAVVIKREPSDIVKIATDIVFTLVSYIALAAVVVIVIAGIIMVANLGNEEQYTKAKKMIISVVIGVIVILLVAALFEIILEGLLT